MSTFNRYCIHFSIFGGVLFIGFILLMIADGGDMLKPVMLIAMTLSELLFILVMSLVFSYMSEPISMTVKIKDKAIFLEQISEISEKKWRRKQIQTKDSDKYCYGFDSKYKNWLTTIVKMEFNDNDCHIVLPKAYKEDIFSLLN